jgi:hypothetical protein
MDGHAQAPAPAHPMVEVLRYRAILAALPIATAVAQKKPVAS